jgi:hypothetical protein
VPATLGYAGSYPVVDQAQGTVTSLRAVGQVVSQGQVLYRVSGAPVVRKAPGHWVRRGTTGMRRVAR